MATYTKEEIDKDFEALIELTNKISPYEIVGTNPEWCALASTLQEKVAYCPDVPPFVTKTVLMLIDMAREKRP